MIDCLRIARLFPKLSFPLSCHHQCMRVPVSPYPHQCWSLSDSFFIIVILVIVKWYLTMALILIFLIINDIEHLFMCIFSICIFSLDKCPLKFITHFLTGLFVFLWLSCKYSIYILDAGPLLDI